MSVICKYPGCGKVCEYNQLIDTQFIFCPLHKCKTFGCRRENDYPNNICYICNYDPNRGQFWYKGWFLPLD